MTGDVLDRVAWRERRRRRVEDLARALALHLADPASHPLDDAGALAATLDDGTGGGPPWSEGLVRRVGAMSAGDPAAWGRFLTRLAVEEGVTLSSGAGKALMDLSPYAGKAALVLDASMGYATVRGDAARVCASAVAAAGEAPRAGRSYLILVEPDVLDGATVLYAERSRA